MPSKLRGEHDIATTPQLVEVLAPLKGNLLVDLSACDFVNSSFAAIVVQAAETLQRDGYRLEVLVPPEKKHLARSLEVTGATEMIPIRESLGESR